MRAGLGGRAPLRAAVTFLVAGAICVKLSDDDNGPAHCRLVQCGIAELAERGAANQNEESARCDGAERSPQFSLFLTVNHRPDAPDSEFAYVGHALACPAICVHSARNESLKVGTVKLVTRTTREGAAARSTVRPP